MCGPKDDGPFEGLWIFVAPVDEAANIGFELPEV
jgi:hypothetical protein